MSITSALFTGVSGLFNNGEAMNVIGNNIANVNTVGFKYARTLFSDMLSANMGNNSQIGRGTQIQKIDNVFSQSSFETTESVTDLALQGNSFFALEGPTGTGEYYTRAGAFRMDSTGYLVNPDGYRVLDEAGTAVYIDPATYGKITNVGPDGTITYLDNTGAQQTYGTRIGIAVVPDTSSMLKAGGTLYTTNGATIQAADGATERMFSNSLELSNVDLASQFVKMIITQRAYSANSKTITTTDEMTQEVLNLKR
jgi:flagellar hook protein FlgE